MTIRTLIVDDEPLARRRVRAMLQGADDFEVVGECGDGESALRGIAELRPDLVFLDIQMPGLDGFAVLASIDAEARPEIVLVTAFDQYAVRAFDAEALDYLLKPFKRARFEESLARVKLRLERRRDPSSDDRFRGLLGRLRRDPERLVIRGEGRIRFLRTAEVEWIAASANYIQIHCGDRVYQVREKISDYECALPADKFLRIHRSIIVNLDFVSEIQACGGGEYLVVLRSGKELSLGRSYVERLSELLHPNG
jgi:two-component system, LytTR family, response regulator